VEPSTAKPSHPPKRSRNGARRDLQQSPSLCGCANARSLSATGLIAIFAIGFDLLSANAQPDGVNAVANVPAAATPITTPPPTQYQFDATFNAAITSDYNYRGYTLSNHKPSASTNFQASYGIFFAGQNSSSVDIPYLGQLESVTAAGIRPVFGPLTIETGAEYFSYPGSQIAVDYLEYYVSPTYAVTPRLALGLNVLYAPDYSRTGAWEFYTSVTAKYTFDSGLSLSAELGRQNFGTTRATGISSAIKLPNYTYWNAGFSYTYKVMTFDLRYYADTLSRQSCYLITGSGAGTPATGSTDCDAAIIATLSWTLGLSNLK
jgi:uncharacterized protein (TIGR02001 family)